MGSDELRGLQHLAAILNGLTPAQQRHLLAGPDWPMRCKCGAIGFPYGCADVHYIFPDTVHALQLCQPAREYLPQSGGTKL